jgi:hypothetical protein
MKRILILIIVIALSSVVLCLMTLTAEAAGKMDKNKTASDRALKADRKGDGRRIALVIGNSDYKYTGTLSNPANDARLMAETLKTVGFELYGGKPQINLSRDDMLTVIDGFGDSIGRGDTALFFYAGHGMQVKGENYLIPVNANIKNEAEVRVKSVESSLLFAKLEGAKNGVNIVILDACRNNPFGRSFRSGNNGLAQVTAPSGTIVAFSTAPNQVAEDGSGGNSTYTRELARFIKSPGLRIEDVFKRVRVSVERSTGGNQQPWENTSLKGDFSFVEGGTDLHERRAMEAEERVRLAEEKAHRAEQLAAEAEEKARQQVAMAPRPQATPRKQLPGKPVVADDGFEFEKDGLRFYREVVLDTRTGLMWARNGNIAGEYMNWNDAISWAKNLYFGGYSDWRLPTKEELDAFAKRRGGDPPSEWFNANGFTSVQSNSYWSSSTYANRGVDYAWYVHMVSGYVNGGDKANDGYVSYVWPVRAGQ